MEKNEQLEKKENKSQFKKLHPLSAGLVLLIDNAFFGASALSLGLGIVPLIFLAFAITSIGVFFSQKYMDHDSTGHCIWKSILLGIAAAVPTSISGTVIGSAILIWAGIKKIFPKK